MLISLLDSHQQISAQSEVFANLRGASPQARVDKFLSFPSPRRIKAVGCKVFYYHPLDGSPAELRSVLHGLPGLCVVHLRRRNILRIIVSHQVANLTGVWRVDRWAKLPQRSAITLSADELEARFLQTRRWEAEAAAEFSRHKYLEVAYEDLVESPNIEIGRILRMLGLPYRQPKTRLTRQNPEPLPTLIANYDELKERFTGTQWESFFSE